MMIGNEKKGENRFSLLITAPASNSGKTAVTCGLLALMKKMGRETCAFKCGPDYIDPMFHRSVLGIESRNLDVFLAGEDGVRDVFEAGSEGMDAAICEGVMGYYDGIAVSSRASGETAGGGSFKGSWASPWHISTLLDLPAVLVVKPGGSALTLASVIKGVSEFRHPSNIVGVIINDCSAGYFGSYAKILEEESGVPVLGYLPHMDEAGFDSRHLGLMTAAEIVDLRERIDRIAETMEETVDVERLIGICSHRLGCGNVRRSDRSEAGHKSERQTLEANMEDAVSEKPDRAAEKAPRIAVAMDEAFCFIYRETLEALEEAGAEPVFFSPMDDEILPEGIGGLYLPGGYPELYAERLASNESMREQIREAVKGGLPTVAECGGFLYLGSELEDGEGRRWPMVGCLPGSSKSAGHLVRFGYGHILPREDSLLFRSGERIPVHEFHYWDTTDNGSDLELVKARDGSAWRFGFCGDRLYAGFPHLYMAGKTGLAERFVAAAGTYKGKE